MKRDSAECEEGWLFLLAKLTTKFYMYVRKSKWWSFITYKRTIWVELKTVGKSGVACGCRLSLLPENPAATLGQNQLAAAEMIRWYEPTLVIPEGCTGKCRGRSNEKKTKMLIAYKYNTPAILSLCKHWSSSYLHHKQVPSSLQTCQCQSLQTSPVGNWWQSVICAFNCVTRFSGTFCQSSEI